MSATVAAVRPSQALRQRRESQRPGIAKASAKSNMENSASREDTKRYVTRAEDILRKFNGKPPSLRVYLHQNHFRLNDSQETLSYASPMRELIAHLKKREVPHNMLEEFYAMNIPFYDNCLIVEVHNFLTPGIKAKDDTSSSADGSGIEPFSIHNYNNFITPSPQAQHPALKAASKPSQGDKHNAGSEGKTDKDVDKENMPAPGQPASQKQPNKSKVSTIVLFPTPQSHLADIQLLATTPLPDAATYRRNQAAARAAGNPPTPLTAVPPTPTLSAGRSPKRPKMVLEEHNLHEFESAVYNATCPKLYLEPTKSFEESLALMEAITHPNNQSPPPTRKTRKRTTAELAADEAEAADIQRYMLAGDEHQASKTAAASGGDEGQHAVRAGANQQTFSRFKTLAAIKTNHEEAERRKKEDEARAAQLKRQNQVEQEAQKRRAELEARQAEVDAAAAQTAAAMAHQKQGLMRQQQQQQQAMAAQQMANANAQISQTPLSATQPQFSSPVVRQQTPMAAAASPLIQTHATHPMGGTPMVATSSSHAAGSPARPPSAVSHHPNAMVRTASQQQNQNLSRTGTPQIVQGTPVMNNSIPARNISSTPTPRMNNQGSPNVSVPGATPIMMQTPQPGQNITPEQIQFAQNQQNMQNQLRVQGMQRTNMSPGNQQQIQQMAIQRANMQIQAHGIPQGQNPQQYRQMLAQRFYQQAIQQQQQQQQQQQNQQQMANLSPQGMPHTGTPNAGGMQIANMNLQQLRQHYMARKQQLINTFGNNVPQQHMVSMRQLEAAINSREAQQQQQAQQQAMSQSNQMHMNQGMPNQMGMQAGGNPQASVQMQQYQQLLQQQRAQQQRQSQIAMMRQQAMQQQGGQMNASMINNMPAGFNVNMSNMNGMNMNMANMQGMAQGNMGMQGMQGMQGMNMGNMQGLNQAQMQQMLMMRQAQQRAAMQQGQQQQGGGEMTWSNV
ncbi:hypothetical protein N0V90_011631 [Kalmusia sp. IMI 367209]|nr:hypothetical protein N0V90_011631 [Kalmusia sp. IMI 367209]